MLQYRKCIFARMVSGWIMVVGFVLVVGGVIFAVISWDGVLEYSDGPINLLMAIIPGLGVSLAGLVLVAIAQVGHAILNMAEDTAAMRALAENQADT